MTSPIYTSRVSGSLTRNGRLTRGGMWFFRGLGIVFLVGVATEWRALITAAVGERTNGQVMEVLAEVYARDYHARVSFRDGRGDEVQIDRSLQQGRRSPVPRLSVGDTVVVAYLPDTPNRAVLDHTHENWRGAPLGAIVGLVLVAISWHLAPGPATTSTEQARRA